MHAMVLTEQGRPLEARHVETPVPLANQVRLRVLACGVCRTDLHVVDGDLKNPKLPLIPGHQIVGRIEALGSEVQGVNVGDRIGAPWLGATCGACAFCDSGRENLCDGAVFTGYQRNGGYAEYAVVNPEYCFPIPNACTDVQAAPLLCAGLIGFRALRLAGDGKRIGLYGFGASAHIVSQVARHQGREVYAFTRPGDEATQSFALELGANWSGGSDQKPPKPLDAAIIFAPVGDLVPVALAAVEKGGSVVCAGIHMSRIPAFDYDRLWGERVVRSVANLTRQDGIDFFDLAPRIPVIAEVETFDLAEANMALDRLRSGQLRGAAVLVPK